MVRGARWTCDVRALARHRARHRQKTEEIERCGRGRERARTHINFELKCILCSRIQMYSLNMRELLARLLAGQSEGHGSDFEWRVFSYLFSISSFVLVQVLVAHTDNILGYGTCSPPSPQCTCLGRTTFCTVAVGMGPFNEFTRWCSNLRKLLYFIYLMQPNDVDAAPYDFLSIS